MCIYALVQHGAILVSHPSHFVLIRSFDVESVAGIRIANLNRVPFRAFSVQSDICRSHSHSVYPYTIRPSPICRWIVRYHNRCSGLEQNRNTIRRTEKAHTDISYGDESRRRFSNYSIGVAALRTAVQTSHDRERAGHSCSKK